MRIALVDRLGEKGNADLLRILDDPAESSDQRELAVVELGRRGVSAPSEVLLRIVEGKGGELWPLRAAAVQAAAVDNKGSSREQLLSLALRDSDLTAAVAFALGEQGSELATALLIEVCRRRGPSAERASAAALLMDRYGLDDGIHLLLDSPDLSAQDLITLANLLMRVPRWRRESIFQNCLRRIAEKGRQLSQERVKVAFPRAGCAGFLAGLFCRRARVTSVSLGEVLIFVLAHLVEEEGIPVELRRYLRWRAAKKENLRRRIDSRLSGV